MIHGVQRAKSAVVIFVKELGISPIWRAAAIPGSDCGCGLQMFAMTVAVCMGMDEDSSAAQHDARIAGLPLP
jgi:hypothetical protein